MCLLDNLEAIRAVDKNGMLDFCVDAPKHYSKAIEIAKKIQTAYSLPDNIIIVGMGGSAIGGDLLKDWARNQLKIPVEINREYYLPEYAGEKTLVLVISYSGDTEESLSAFMDALKRRCMIYCISSGGELLKYAKKYSVPHILVPEGMQPRAALPYLLVPMLVFMEKAGLVNGLGEELNETVGLLEKISKENGPDKSTDKNLAKSIAQKIGYSIPTVYGFDFFRSTALRFKQQFNENSKSPAKGEVFPELNHNEIVGWEHKDDLIRRFSVIFIRDQQEPFAIRSRIEITKEIMDQAGLMTYELEVQGRSRLAKIISTVVLGDFISVYLGVLHGVDPTPVRNINFLKEVLKQKGIKEKIIEELEAFKPQIP